MLEWAFLLILLTVSGDIEPPGPAEVSGFDTKADCDAEREFRVQEARARLVRKQIAGWLVTPCYERPARPKN